ncbi:Mov34/MPN/PAD-1 family protein [Bradyrhizobium sp. BR 10289]|uniref:Mov34/MPN/PAD-1 family protein n=1 Tax=Bradyrhizobium sp. BR 10289 TaxID=2749993 RepID=UPI001C64B8E7|nr:Mov34/MPN/PAD-1 family protein [Bradyrhizobium sp. BR 10289]MBW7973562.1 Mov34/MPN/PAD-1 family protein [Bradyrhizobium sp. BR 10289]
MTLLVPREIVARTIDILRRGGAEKCEAVVLWLGSGPRGAERIAEAYRPDQIADKDFFRIPSAAMKDLMGHLRRTRLHVTAQVHSHPGRAFHSEADDEWAIVRHRGALSFVVPRFGAGSTVANFMDQTAIYRLSDDDRWIEVPDEEVLHTVELA